MQALGNDFVMIDRTQMADWGDLAEFCRKVSHRTRGIGCDLVTFYSFDVAAISASFFNADGSEAEICGNAGRCLGLLAQMRQPDQKSFLLKTQSRTYVLHRQDDANISINFGKPMPLALSEEVPNPLSLRLSDDLHLDNDVQNKLAQLGLRQASCLSVGNPHLVLLVERMPSLEQAQHLGSILENNSLFPARINVSFGKIISSHSIDLLVFERADGLTSACGSGAMATAIVAKKNNLLESDEISVIQRGGSLLMHIDSDGNCTQTGSATHVFSGQYKFASQTITPPKENNSSKFAEADGEKKPLGNSLENVTIYTDGACSGNPGPGGWAALLICADKEQELCGSEPNTTNNRMEMMAAIAALEYFPTPCTIELYTDSTYVKNGITKWIQGWLKNNWISSDKKPVKNKDLWLRLLKATELHEVFWHWVEGHSGNKFNERVDKIAKNQSRKQ
jgi:ribonuclease HI